MKETDQELLDEMIVKDVPESESSSDPAKKFEETIPPASIESIKEEDSDSECKDLSFNNLYHSSNIPEPSYPNLSFTKPQTEVAKIDTGINEPTKITIKSPTSTSDTESEEDAGNVKKTPAYITQGKDEVMTTTDTDALTSRPSSSEPERSTHEGPAKIAIKSPTSSETESEHDAAKAQISSAYGKETSSNEEIMKITIKSATSSETESEEEAIEIEESPAYPTKGKEDITTTTDSEIVTSRPSSTEPEKSNVEEESPVILRKSKPSIDTSRPSSSDFSDAEFKKMTIQEKISRFNESVDKPIRPSSSEYDSDHREIKSQRPESSDYDSEAKIEEHVSSQVYTETISKYSEKKLEIKESNIVDSVAKDDDKPIGSILNKINQFNSGSVSSLDREPIVTQQDKFGEENESSEDEEELKPLESVKDRISRFNSGSVTSLDKEPRPLSAQSSEVGEKKEKVEETRRESVKERISRLNSGSITSLDKDIRPPSSTHSDVHEKESKVEISKTIVTSEVFVKETSSISSIPTSIDSANKIDLDLPVSSIKDKMSMFHQGSEMSQEDDLGSRSRPISSDYSDIFDPHKEEQFEKRMQEDEPMESIKERISRFNSGSVTSLDKEAGYRIPSRPSSGYSDFSERKALFEHKDEETKTSKISLISETSSESESYSKHVRESSSEYSENEERSIDHEMQQEDKSDMQQEDISEVTEHIDTVRERNSEDDSTDSEMMQAPSTEISINGALNSQIRVMDEPRHVRPVSSDYSDIEINTQKNEKKSSVSSSELKIENKEQTMERVSISSTENKVVLNDVEPKIDQAEEENVPAANRPTSSDYSDIFDQNKVEDLKRASTVSSSSLSEGGEVEHNVEAGKKVSIEDDKPFTGRPISSDYSDIFDKNKVEDFKRASIVSSSSSADEQAINIGVSNKESEMKRHDTSSSEEQNDENIIQHSSSDSSVSKPKSDQELTRQDAFEIEEGGKKLPLTRKQSSSEYSESDFEGRKPVDSSSDYDSASNRGGKKRPDSFISDASSDYDSLSNVGSRRPQSFVLDDEYDIITEEGESERHAKGDDASSSSESEGPDAKEAGKMIKRIPPPGVLKESSGEDEDQDGEDEDGTSVPPISQIPNQSSSSTLFQSSNMHVEQSSVSITLDQSSVTTSNTLDSNITKNVAEITEKRSYQESTIATSSEVKFTTTDTEGSSKHGSSQGISAT